jgi:NAD(P)-dependent dehydrogenase (short-subunit alcohol dehydrogenase family)
MPGRLAGKVALVTGAGSSGPGWGNGKATAVLFAREGAKVFLVDVNAEAAAETKAIIEGEGGSAAAWRADVSQAGEVAALVARCVELHGRIDVLHNNVGISALGGAVETDEASWDRVFQVNLKSVFLTCKHVLPIMVAQGGGSIVNISSVASIRWGGVAYLAYSASKAALNQLTKCVGLEYAARGIRCNCILPGLMDTPMPRLQLMEAFAGTGGVEEMLRVRDAMSPTGKQGEPWDVAYAALFLASDESKYVNATELVVDGGLTQATAAPRVTTPALDAARSGGGR